MFEHKNKKHALGLPALFALSTCISATTWAGPDYYGHSNSEAKLILDAERELISAKPEGPSIDDARKAIGEQLTYASGPLQFSKNPIKAAPKLDYLLSNLKITKKADADPAAGKWNISYTVEETIAINGGKDEDTLEVILPTGAGTDLYDASISSKGSMNLCTDSGYQSQGDFWYFWSPDRPGCTLQENVDFKRFTGQVTRIKNTVITYPEYNRLVTPDHILPISVFFGVNDKFKNPESGSDVGASEYIATRDELLSRGYQLIERQPKQEKRAYWIVLEKETLRATIRVKMFFGRTGATEDESNGNVFHQAFADAMENSSVILYAGHSGLGGNLNLSRIENDLSRKLKIDPDRYQIVLADGCSSYSYYNLKYYTRKSSKNLDIVTNAIESTFSRGVSTSAGILRAVDSWAMGDKVISYQEIIESLHLGNFLTGVNGDQDNPTDPALVAPDWELAALPAGANSPSKSIPLVDDTANDNLMMRAVKGAFHILHRGRGN